MLRHNSFMKWRGLTLILSIFALGILTMSFISPTPSNFTTTHTPSPQVAVDPDYSSTNLNITYLERQLKVTEFNTVEMTDEYFFFNNGSESVANVYVFIRNEFINDLYFFQAYDYAGGSMQMFDTGNQIFDYSVYEVVFNEPMLSYDSKNFSVHLVFGQIYSINEAGSFTFNCPYNPITSYSVEDFHARLSLPISTVGIEFTPPVGYPVGPNSTDSTTDTRSIWGDHLDRFEDIRCVFDWENSRYGPVSIKTVDRTVDVNPWGYIRVQEAHTVYSENEDPISSLTFYLSRYASDVKMYDYLGEFLGITKTEVLEEDNTYEYTVDLTENRGSILFERELSYTLEYQLDWEIFHSKELGTNNININVFTTKIPYLVEEMTTTVNLIGVRKITRLNQPLDNVIDTTDGMSLEFYQEGVTVNHEFMLDVSYKSNFLITYARPLIFTVLFVTIIGLYVLISSNRQKDTQDSDYIKETIPISELSRFIELYEEKNAAQVDVLELENQLRSKRIRKKDYNREIKTLSVKLKDLQKEIEPFKSELIHSTKTLQNILQKLDYLEAEKISVQDGIKMLVDRYKKGKLPSKAAYERLADEMRKRTQTAQNKIDRYINELRAFLR